MICVIDIYVTYMSVTYMLHICTYMSHICLVHILQYISLTCDTSVNILTCVYTSMIHTMCIIKISNAHRAMPQIKSFMQCSNTYMHTTHVINSNREHSEILKRFFDKLVDIEINIIFKI